MDKKEYEIALLLKAEEDINAAKELMKKHGFDITFESPFRRMTLAYPINKETSAVFGWFYVMSETSLIKEFTKEIKNETWCVRSIVVKDPIKRDVNRDESGERYIRREAPAKPKEEEKTTSSSVTNEDLEKKLEEILK